jgi:prepilin peptidase CpaA
MLHLPSLLLSVWACSIAYFDARYKRIPNVLSLSAWGVGIACLLLSQSSLLGASPGSALLAAAFGLLVTLPGYATKRLGAGDVKFMVAIGLLTTLDIAVKSFVIAALTGGLIALLWVNAHWLVGLIPKRLMPQQYRQIFIAPAPNARHMAYGPLLALGLIVSLWIG